MAVPPENQDPLVKLFISSLYFSYNKHFFCEETARQNVAKQQFLMQRKLDDENLKDALKYATHMIYELKTAKLGPQKYYELCKPVFLFSPCSLFFSPQKKAAKKLWVLSKEISLDFPTFFSFLRHASYECAARFDRFYRRRGAEK